MNIPDAIRNDTRFISRLNEIKNHSDWSSQPLPWQERRAVWFGFDELKKPEDQMNEVQDPNLRKFLKGEVEEDLDRSLSNARTGSADFPTDSLPMRPTPYTADELTINKYIAAVFLRDLLANPEKAGTVAFEPRMGKLLGQGECAQITRNFFTGNQVDKRILVDIISTTEAGYIAASEKLNEERFRDKPSVAPEQPDLKG